MASHHFTLSALASRITTRAVSKSRESPVPPDVDSPAAVRNTINPSACDVMLGTTRSFALAARPTTTIRRGRRQLSAPRSGRALVAIVSRSSCPSVADQLIRMSMTSPSGRCNAPTSSGSSVATDAVCGHQAPSISPPNSPASMTRIGREARRDHANPFTGMANQQGWFSWADRRRPEPGRALGIVGQTVRPAAPDGVRTDQTNP